MNESQALLRPLGWKGFFLRRIRELLGLGLVIFALAFLLSVLTLHETDPGFTRATGTPVRNLMGLPGAYIADFMLEGLGLAAFFSPLLLLVWGTQMIRHRPLNFYWWLRLSLWPFASLGLAMIFASLPGGGIWPFMAGLGGFAGKALLAGQGNGGLVALLVQLHVPPFMGTFPVTAAFMTLLPTIPLIYLTFGLSLKSYLASFYAVKSFGGYSSRWMAGASSIGNRGLNQAQTLPMQGQKNGGWLARWRGRLRKTQPISNAYMPNNQAAHSPMARAEPSFGGAGNASQTSVPQNLPAFGQARRAIIMPEPEPQYEEEPIEPLVEMPVAMAPKKPRKVRSVPQPKLALEENAEFELPALDYLARATANEHVQRLNEEGLEKNARLLESVLDDFGVKGQIVKVRPGPVVTLYELEPAPGTKTSRVVSLADDVARSMSALSVRIAVVPGRSVIGIELPNQQRETVALRELFEDPTYAQSPGKLALAVGKDIGGQPIVVDLARMPHLLIAGTTGSGKSVAINTMILSLLYRLTPEQCKFIMIDPKMLELSIYDGIPHLLSPVVTEPRKAVVALKWVVREMENRYRSMSKLGVRNIDGYNQRIEQAQKNGESLTRRVQTGFDPETGKPIYEEEPFDLRPYPYIVVIVDEMADLMLVAGKDIEAAIQRLAQMARAAGIHLVMATQRPSVDVITGTIKANFPTRISFHVTTKIDSRTILGETGAEQLLGQGDMLYMANGGRVTRVHGPFVSDREVESIVQFLKAQGTPSYLEEVTEEQEEAGAVPGMASSGEGGEDNALYDQAVQIVLRERKISTSFIQRHLQIGYNRAARLVERMEKEGVISAPSHSGKREVLVPGSSAM